MTSEPTLFSMPPVAIEINSRARPTPSPESVVADPPSTPKVEKVHEQLDALPIEEAESATPQRAVAQADTQSDQDDPPVLLTERDAAKALAVCPRTLWQLRKDGKIPCVRIGRAVRYRQRDLSAWINRNIAAAPPGTAP